MDRATHRTAAASLVVEDQFLEEEVMKVGFTGTRHGMTREQKQSARNLLASFQASQVHHGDCVGADREFHALAVSLGVYTVAHPPIDRSRRAFSLTDETKPVKDYLVRNRNIVRETNVLVACPQEDREPSPGRGQGTWSTVRYARDILGREVHIIWPSGKIRLHHGSTTRRSS